MFIVCEYMKNNDNFNAAEFTIQKLTCKLYIVFNIKKSIKI